METNDVVEENPRINKVVNQSDDVVDNEEKVDDEKDPLLKLYLPYNISSVHTCCQATSPKNESNLLSLDGENHNGANEVDTQIDLALTYFEKKEYKEAFHLFESLLDVSIVAKYYVSILLYDGLTGHEDYKQAVSLMRAVVESNLFHHEKLIHCAQYNLGRAYYEGFGVKQSDNEAEKWWLLSARNGEDGGCVKAQSILAMFYSRLREDSFDLKKAHFWHQEATGNGSIESQTALGMMYEHGMGVEKSKQHAFKCFKSAATRGSVYAMGNLALNYYQNKMFRNACAVAKKVGSLSDTKLLSVQTDCLEAYVRKGIALGCFIYGRCIWKGLEEETDDKPGKWYSRAAKFDMDVTKQMQDLVTEGKI